jgi:hypothetical protein
VIRLPQTLVVLAVTVGVLGAGAALAGGAPAGAAAGSAAAPPGAGAHTQQADDPQGGATDETTADETTRDTGVPTQDIIPKPNSGQAPSEAGDRGGSLQLALLVLIVVAVGGIVAKVVHDSRRARQPRASSPAAR